MVYPRGRIFAEKIRSRFPRKRAGCKWCVYGNIFDEKVEKIAIFVVLMYEKVGSEICRRGLLEYCVFYGSPIISASAGSIWTYTCVTSPIKQKML